MTSNFRRVFKPRLIVFILVLALFSTPAFAAHKHPEKWYQDIWCEIEGGQTEVIMADGTRCDCLTKTHAVEFDFGKKWAEAIGQALCYSMQTGKRAGIVLILEEKGDQKYWQRLNTIIKHHKLPIDTWKMKGY